MKSHKRIDAIDALIPEAQREAYLKVKALGKTSEIRTRLIGKRPESVKRPFIRDKKGLYDSHTTYQHCFFTEYFHKAMNRITRERGLRV